MKVLGLFNVTIGNKEATTAEPKLVDIQEVNSSVMDLSREQSSSSMQHGHAYVHSFDGERTAGEIGPVRRIVLNFHGLRNRSWEALITSEIAKTVLSRYFVWIIVRMEFTYLSHNFYRVSIF